MGLLLDSSRLFRLHLMLIGLLVGAHVAAATIRLLTGHANLYGLTPLFDLDVEANVPTMLSAVALLGAAGLFWVTGSATRRHGRAYATHWRALAVVFVLLALDEAAGFHEKLSAPLRDSMQLTGVLHYAWIVPYALMVAALAIVYSRFLLALDPVAKRHLGGAGVVFLAGVVGFEMVGGLIASSRTRYRGRFRRRRHLRGNAGNGRRRAAGARTGGLQRAALRPPGPGRGAGGARQATGARDPRGLADAERGLADPRVARPVPARAAAHGTPGSRRAARAEGRRAVGETLG